MTPVSLTDCSALSSDHFPLLIDMTCCSTFINLTDSLDFKWTEGTTFQECLENNFPLNPELHDKETVDTCVEDLSSAILSATAVATPKSHPRSNPRPPLLAVIQDKNMPKKPVEEPMAGNQGPRSQSRSQPSSEISDLPAAQVEFHAGKP